MARKVLAEAVVKDIQRRTRKKYSAEEKIRIVLEGLRGESPAILADFSIPGARIVCLLDELALCHGPPEEIVMDNGPELTSKAMFLWSQRTGVRLRFIEPGMPIQNIYVESFLGGFRDECLNEHWFGSLAEARRTIEAWRRHYNEARAHIALGYETPEAYARRAGAPELNGAPRACPSNQQTKLCYQPRNSLPDWT